MHECVYTVYIDHCVCMCVYKVYVLYMFVYIYTTGSVSLENPDEYGQSAQGHCPGLEGRGRTAWDTYALGLRGNLLFLLTLQTHSPWC